MKKFIAYTNWINEKFTEESDPIHDLGIGRPRLEKIWKKQLKDMGPTNVDEFYDEHLTDIVIMVSVDEKRAAAEFICNGTYKSTCVGLPQARGQKYKLPVGCFFEIKNDKIARVTNYYNMNDWLAQVK